MRRVARAPEGYRWRGRRTRGEINSARPYLAAAPCWVSAEHAVLGKSPFLPLAVTPCPLTRRNPFLGRFAEGYSVSLPVPRFLRRARTERERERERERDSPGSHRGRTEPYGECRTEWMNAAETERLAPLPLAQTLPRRPVGRPQLP